MTHSEESSKTESKSGIDDLRAPIEAALLDASQFDPGCPARLAEAMRYALLAPGKRLRPALVLMSAEACGGDLDGAMPGAVAVEMVHAYSLIHDDLPAMDDDDLRRGRPTVHIQFDEATAILAGDALLAQAFAHLGENVTDARLGLEAIRVLAKAAGPSHLVGGQADDLDAETPERGRAAPPENRVDASEAETEPLENDFASELEQLESIHRRKTGALISASIDLGAILSGAESEQRRILSDYAREVGLAFQIVDDLLDFTSDDAVLGKRAGKDAERGKLTYPGLLGIEGARTRARELVESAQRRIAVFGSTPWRLIWLANYVLERSH